MAAYVLRRLVLAVPLLLAVSLLVFAVVSAFPGDPCLVSLGNAAKPERIQACRLELGLDRPFVTRYVDFLGDALRFDFGKDVYTGEDVGPVIARRLAATAELSLFALLLAVCVGTWVGTRSALKPGGWTDLLGQLLALGGTSIPVFWLGMLLIVLFGVKLEWLPFSGWTASEIGPGVSYRTGFLFFESLLRGEWGATARAVHHLVLPAVALATIPLAVITRMTRSATLEEVGKDYVTTARAKGISEGRVMGHHVRRNVLIPVVTITGLQLGTLLSGAVLTETVFSWPGMGTHFVSAALGRNTPVVVASMLLFTVIFVLVNLLVDLLYHAIDPRLRLPGGS